MGEPAPWSLTLRDIQDGLRARPGRFLLSFFAIAIGITALALLLAVLSGLQARAESLVRDLGGNVVAVVREARSRTGASGLKLHHGEMIRRNFPGTMVSTVRRYEAPTLGTREPLNVIATDGELLAARQWRLLSGRFLDSRDMAQGARNAVISSSLRERWGWDVGGIVYVYQTPFKVVGVVDVGGQALSEAGDTRLLLGERVVLVPRSVIPYWDRGEHNPMADVDAFFVRASHREAQDLVPALRRVLLQPDQRAGEFSLVTPQSLIANIGRLQRTIGLTAGAVALLCLVLGGTTLMSLMVANVRERVTEIGLRRAMGATYTDIITLFALEAVAVTAAAGLTGTAVAHLLLWLSRGSTPLPVQAGLVSVLAPLLVAVVLGAIFSWWPARSAARVTPSEALRDE